MKHQKRQFEYIFSDRLRESPRLIQVILGPRQVGKTSGVLNVLKKDFKTNQYSYFVCEEGLMDSTWIQACAQQALEQGKKIIVFDEIQKIEGWTNQIKLIWDANKRNKKQFHLVLLGSSSLQISQGLGDSLAGRFEIIPVHHWSYIESRKAFGLNIEQYITYGGYPGSYHLLKEPSRFNKYVYDSLFETAVTKDILHYVTIKKPALFRQTFKIACGYPAQEVSYNKLLGQLQDAGNVDQVKNYLDLFSQAFLIRLIYKWGSQNFVRTSSPKILPCASVYIQLFTKSPLSSEQLGRTFESIVGNRLAENFQSLYYWREGKFEVDFIVEDKGNLYAIEVKTKNRKSNGLAELKKKYPQTKACYIHFDNYEVFEKDPVQFLEKYAF